MKRRTYQIVVVPNYKIVRATQTENTGNIETIATLDSDLAAEMLIDNMKENDLNNGYTVKVKSTKY